MTDPLEDRLRSHFAERADRVTAEPDPSTLVERSAVRPHLGVALLASLVAVVAVLTGGGFLTGIAVASSSPAPAPRPGPNVPAASSGSAVASAPAVGPTAATSGVAQTFTSLFTRTTTSGVTIRAYGSGAATGVVPAPVSCLPGVMCAQPIITPLKPVSGPAATGTASSVSGRAGASASAGGSGPATTIGTAVLVPQVSRRCQEVTLEMSTEQAVSSVAIVGPTAASVAPSSMQLLGTGSFGQAEGGPVGWVALAVGSNVSSVRLESATGTVVDTMAPISGMVVLAAPGSTVPGGMSVVFITGAGSTVATLPANQGMYPAPGCTPVTPIAPVNPPATVPTTSIAPRVSTTTTTDPTTSTVVPSTSGIREGPVSPGP
jgi:hypothetical protein